MPKQKPGLKLTLVVALAALLLMSADILFAQFLIKSNEAADSTHPKVETPKVKDSSRQTPAGNKKPISEAATQTRVRELIYILRQHRVFERGDEWGAAIRELVEIGSPALPELLLEVKSTERNATLRGLLFALRAINDPRGMPIVIEALPKAERLSENSSDCGVYFANADLHKFMRQHQDFPSRDNDVSSNQDDDVSYGRPINEILSTLHTLARQPFPDLTKGGPHPTWNTNYWQQWWKKEGKADFEKENRQTIQLPSRNEDLVERDGVRRFGALFPTGPKQRLSPVMDVTLRNNGCADTLSCLDLETGRLYEYREGMHCEPGKVSHWLDYHEWVTNHGIDLMFQDDPDLHIWLIDNDRWDSFDAEVQSDKPMDIGREANRLTPFDKDRFDLKPDQTGTFLFTTREGSQGILRAYPPEKDGQSRRFEYRLWNYDKIEARAHTIQPPRDPGEWQPAKIVSLKEPGFGKRCLYDLEKGRAEVLPYTIFTPDPLPNIEELSRTGGILTNDRIANWARDHGINLTTSRVMFAAEDDANKNALKILPDGFAPTLMLLDCRCMVVTSDAFNNITVAHAKSLLARNPMPFRLSQMNPRITQGDPQTCVFETKSGLIGLLQILKFGDNASSISFRYELAKSPEKSPADKR